MSCPELPTTETRKMKNLDRESLIDRCDECGGIEAADADAAYEPFEVCNCNDEDEEASGAIDSF